MSIDNDWQATRDRLLERADRDWPEQWDKDGEPVLLGTMMDARLVSGQFQYRGDEPVVVVEVMRPDDTLVSVWLWHTALLRAFERERPQRGERIMVKYLGKTQSKTGGDPYHDYRLAVDRPDDNREVDWAKLTAHAPTGAAPDHVLAGPLAPPDDDIPF